MMYDYEIIVPIETNDKRLLTRAHDFRKYGLQNIGNRKIKLYLMLSAKNRPEEINYSWPDNVDVEAIVTPYGHVAQKIYHYYSTTIEPNRAKWYMRIDEDSITDLDKLFQTLELEFDHTREYHIVSEFSYDVQPIDQTLLTMLGFGNWYRPHPNMSFHIAPPHEHEISITSNAAVQRMKSNDVAMRYLEMRKEFAEGYGDHSMTHALKIAKVYPTLVKFLTHEAELCNLSLFGGIRHHVHWISRDRNPKALYWLDTFNKEPYPAVENQTFFFGPKNGAKKVVKFNENHTVTVIQTGDGQLDYKNTDQIGLWCKIDNTLAVYSDDNDEEVAYFQTTDEKLFVWNDYALIKINYAPKGSLP